MRAAPVDSDVFSSFSLFLVRSSSQDACNRKSNQQNLGTIKCSNLCTEVSEGPSKCKLDAAGWVGKERG